MKVRHDFVTNSSSSSFILTNHTDQPMTSEEFAKKLVQKVIEDAKDRFILNPGESISYECGDHDYDGAFEVFIHEVVGDTSFWLGDKPEPYGWGNSDEVEVQFSEDHH